MAFTSFLDPVLSPLLKMDPLLAVGIMSLLISVIITVIYKFTTDQNLMKRLKDEMKDLQKQMRELKSHPEKMMEVNKRAMESNMKYMGQSLKSTLYTFIPIILLFTWMNAHFAFEAIHPNDQFSVTLQFTKNTIGDVSVKAPEGINIIGNTTQTIQAGKAIFHFTGKEGEYSKAKALTFDFQEKLFYKDILVTPGVDYTPKEEKIKDANLQMISINYGKRKILPGLNWGWLGSYILFSIVFSMALRKWMKVY